MSHTCRSLRVRRAKVPIPHKREAIKLGTYNPCTEPVTEECGGALFGEDAQKRGTCWRCHRGFDTKSDRAATFEESAEYNKRFQHRHA